MPDETEDLTPSLELDQLLADYVAAEEAGQTPDRQELLARHPQLAAELREFFANRDQMQRMVAPLRGEEAQQVRTVRAAGNVRYFGDYELLDEIAAGGMGVVYKARQVSLNRIVAVKMILKGTLASEEDVKRFRAEAEAAANLQHPAIVAIHEVGLHEGQHYFSMDYVEGQSLAELPRQQPLSGRQAAEYVRDAAEAVHYAHQQGTLHRDLKPSNILIDRHGRVRITDFGLAKRIEGNSELTLTGQILGTPSYMPPEQASGKRSLIGAASDIYALGAVLYDLLTGRPPFRGESPAETLRQVESLDPLSPRLLNPTTPRDLETICLKCLEKEPHKRYGTAQLLADDLGRYLRGEPIVARPISRVARGLRWCRRNPVVAGLSGAVALLLITVAMGSTIASIYLKQQRDTVASQKGALEQQAQDIQRESDRAQAAEHVANQRLYQSLVNQARASRFSRRAGQRLQSLGAIQEAAELARRLHLGPEALGQLRDDYLASLSLVDLAVEREWQLSQNQWYVAFDNSLQRYAAANADHSLSIRLVRDDTEAILLPSVGKAPQYRQFSPDGRWLAVAYSDGRVLLWDAMTGQKVFEQMCRAEPEFDFSPDSQTLALTVGTAVELRRAPDWKADKTNIKNARFVSFHPDGVHLATTSSALVEIWELEANQKITHVSFPTTISGRIDWRPDGRFIAVPCSDFCVYVYEFPRVRQWAVLRGHSNQGCEAHFSHDGSLLATHAWDGTTRLWDPLSGRELMQVNGLVRGFSADDRQLTYNDGFRAVGMWNLAGNRERRILGSYSRARNTGIAISRSGQVLAASGGDGIALWELPEARPAESMKGGLTYSVQFDASDRLLFPASTHLRLIPFLEGEDGRPQVNLAGETQIGKGKLGTTLSGTVISQDGSHALAWLKPSTAIAFPLSDSELTSRMLSHSQLHRHIGLALSPNGQWAATMTWAGRGLRIWNVASGKLVKDLWPESYTGYVGFSPDGRWLAASVGTELRTWEVPGWTPRARRVRVGAGDLPGPVAFSLDGQLLAAAMSRSGLALLDPATCTPLVAIEPPNVSYEIVSLAFAPNSSLLAIAYSDSVDLWNLALVREQLRELGLDWQAPSSSEGLPLVDSRGNTSLDSFGVLPRADGRPEVRRAAQDSVNAPLATESRSSMSVSSRAAAASPNLAALEQSAAQHVSSAAALKKQGNSAEAIAEYGEAIPLYEQVRDLRQAKSGLQHPDTLRTIMSLATAYREAGRMDEAIQLFELVCTTREKQLGANHRDTLSALHSLAITHSRAGNSDQSIKVYERVVEARAAILGSAHGDTLHSMNNLAYEYTRTKQWNRAVPMYEDTLKRRVATLGPENADTLITQRNLGRVYLNVGKPEQAIPLLEAAYPHTKGDPSLAWVFTELTKAYEQVGRTADGASVVVEPQK